MDLVSFTNKTTTYLKIDYLVYFRNTYGKEAMHHSNYLILVHNIILVVSINFFRRSRLENIKRLWMMHLKVKVHCVSCVYHTSVACGNNPPWTKGEWSMGSLDRRRYRKRGRNWIAYNDDSMSRHLTLSIVCRLESVTRTAVDTFQQGHRFMLLIKSMLANIFTFEIVAKMNIASVSRNWERKL